MLLEANKPHYWIQILLPSKMEDYFNDTEKIYNSVDVMKMNIIRKKLIYFRKHKTKFGPQQVEIETIDSLMNQCLGVVFQKGLEVDITLHKNEIVVNVVKSLRDDNFTIFTNSIIDELNTIAI